MRARDGDNPRRRSAAPAVVIVTVALLLLAAHFLRSFALPFVALFALLPLLLAVRRAWAVRVVQAALLFGAFEWFTTTVRILGERRASGEPAGRMLLIMGTVIGFTVLAGFLLETAGPRARYSLRTGRLFQTAPPGAAPAAEGGGAAGVDPSRDDLFAVAAFTEIFKNPGFVAGSWHHPDPGPDGVQQLSYWEPVRDVRQWHDALYRHGLVASDFDWSAADWREEMERLRTDPSPLVSADLATIRKVLTTIARADRFNEGFMGSMFDAGVAQAATQRLAVLAFEMGA